MRDVLLIFVCMCFTQQSVTVRKQQLVCVRARLLPQILLLLTLYIFKGQVHILSHMS